MDKKMVQGGYILKILWWLARFLFAFSLGFLVGSAYVSDPQTSPSPSSSVSVSPQSSASHG